MSTEKEWVRAALAGDWEAFGAIVRKYANVLHAVAYEVVRDYHQAQDIAQETFLKAYMNLHTLQKPEKLGSWLYSIARRLSLNARRTAGRHTSLEETSDLPHDQSVEETVMRSDVRRQVLDALNSLNEPQRLAATLFYFGGFTIKETAEMLEISVDAAESRIRRSRELLKKELFVLMEDIGKQIGFGQDVEREVLRSIVPRIATIEIPVSDLCRAVEWYGKMLGAKPQGDWSGEGTTAMLHFQGGSGAIGVPSIYLVKTEDTQRLTFKNTRHGYVQSVIDLYTHDLRGYYDFLRERGVDVNEMDWEREPHRPGFGFRDCDGNSFGVCNIELTGQGGLGNQEIPDAHSFVWRVAGVEIPVNRLKQAVEWYTAVFGMKVLGEPVGEWEAAMLYLDGGERLGVPNFYLVETKDEQRLTFKNTYTNVTHSVIDFYSADVDTFLTGLRNRKIPMNGQSGFFDPDGNSLAVCDAVHRGQARDKEGNK
ncbi:sigma-70 family RNA polymerase sigma factor [Cohnella cholangitidis]|uniref:RNA polymerase sigma factor n=1 Tax=Cohnella cholangitidis TaxID=2598458 RepID=A0A7G5BYJ6_9BACL|nr:sigma-70 family RNA polymerase sigma factor [Cohnella cholangitidis]QMV42030.1 sigma-70 family RNA polymerase sigma factor [Cohnella cholangitidis]